MDDLVRKLRMRREAEMIGGYERVEFEDKDALEAADRIEAQAAEINRLREMVDAALTSPAPAPDDATVEHHCPYCSAQVLLMGASYLDELTAALNAVGAPKWNADHTIMFSIIDRIAALRGPGGVG